MHLRRSHPSLSWGVSLSQQVMLDDVHDKTKDLRARTDLTHNKVIDMIEDLNSCKKYGLMLCLFVTFLILLFLVVYT